MFTKEFNKYACNADTITCTVDGFDCTATIYHDDDSSGPDERQDGFWPSLNPKNAGYIGDGKTQSDLSAAHSRALAVMEAWERDEWWYAAIAVTVSKNGIQLTDDFGFAIWGVECNYPGSDNSYLTEVANDLIPNALQAAKDAISKLCADSPILSADFMKLVAGGTYSDETIALHVRSFIR